MTDSSKTPRYWVGNEALILAQNMVMTFVYKKEEKDAFPVVTEEAYQALEKELAIVKRQLEVCKEHFSDLVRDCKWYADNGLEQERHHFLMVEAQGNYLDLAENELEKIQQEMK